MKNLMKGIVWGDCTCMSLSPSANSEDDREGPLEISQSCLLIPSYRPR